MRKGMVVSFLHCCILLTVMTSVGRLAAQSTSPAQSASPASSHVLTYSNPILAGFYPDPSICRAGNDYYLINSTFAYTPAIPIFHSRDLVSWQQIGSAMDRPSQLEHLLSITVSQGLFAPTIRYNDGIFFITCTFVEVQGGNFVITAKDPRGPWSQPIFLPDINGIDPSLFFDDDNKAYIIYNSIAPDNKPLYEGHRTIRMRAFDPKGLRTTGEESILVNGGSDLKRKPVWIEGPHLFKKDGYYYLIAAEGGTEYNHSEVVFRSLHVTGPYTPFDKNPILTQRQLDRHRPSPVTSTGHADFVMTPGGAWYSVFLGCRPYSADYYNTGRETFMAPVEWKNDWPIIVPSGAIVEDHYPVPFPKTTRRVSNPYNGLTAFKESFSGPALDRSWLFLRVPTEKWYSLSERKGFFSMRLLPLTCDDAAAFIGHRQQQPEGYATTALDFQPAGENEKAGLLVFQNESHFYYLCRSVKDRRPVVQLFRSTKISPSAERVPPLVVGTPAFDSARMELITSQDLDTTALSGNRLQLKIIAKEDTYSFYYSTKKGAWNMLKEKVDAKFLSTHTAGGFTGCLYALYATSLGLPSKSTAYFDWFAAGP